MTWFTYNSEWPVKLFKDEKLSKKWTPNIIDYHAIFTAPLLFISMTFNALRTWKIKPAETKNNAMIIIFHYMFIQAKRPLTT